MRVLVAGCVIAAVAAGAEADKITRKDGSILTGKIISEDERTVTLEMVRYGAKIVIDVPRSKIHEIVRRKEPVAPVPTTQPDPEPTGPTYYPIPIIGEIGVEVTPQLLKQAFNDARSHKPAFVVLYVDSLGGSTDAMQAILKELSGYPDLKTVVLIRRALGSAAVVAMSCKMIFLTPDGSIGDVSFLAAEIGGKGNPADPRTLSALRAVCRAAAHRGGHDDLLIRGMMELNLRIVQGIRNGRPALSETGDGQVVKTEGKLLTLTAREAVSVGLAAGISKDAEGLHGFLGLDKWTKSRGGGWYLMARLGKENRLRAHQAAYRAARDAYMKQITDELGEIDRSIEGARARGRIAEAKKKDLQDQQKVEERNVRAEYWLDRQEAARIEATNPDLAIRLRARARENYDFKRLEIRRRYQLQHSRVDDVIAEMTEEIRRLNSARKKLLDGVPKYAPPKPVDAPR